MSKNQRASFRSSTRKPWGKQSCVALALCPIGVLHASSVPRPHRQTLGSFPFTLSAHRSCLAPASARGADFAEECTRAVAVVIAGTRAGEHGRLQSAAGPLVGSPLH